ncbi:S-4TM family putative pore-forming effector [Clostridium perfringens]|nr:S-4TM family putative pore-forming effector [Clostridium perfringens]MDM0493554.1 S-4TM family putative pore-forming effector [Clostridium perfringens]
MGRQLDKKATEYMNGFKYTYNIAKIYNLSIIFISFIVSIASLINSIIGLEIQNLIAFFSFIWFVIGIFLKKSAVNNRKKAADLQELFDVYIMNIPRNDKIISLNNENYIIMLKKNSNLEKYYDIDEEFLEIRDIFLLQKNNIIYDKIMRFIYLYINLFVMILYIIISIAFSIFNKLDIYETVIVLMVPSINIFNYFINNILCLKSEINEINKLDIYINNSISSYQNKSDSENIKEIRQYQDFIYLKRKNWTMIPNYIYKLYLKSNKFFYQINQENNLESKDLQKEAINIEKELGLINFLKQYGQVEIVGSVANNLIVNKDIDIHLLTNNNINNISKKLIEFLKCINEIRNIKIEDYNLEKKSICVIVENYNNWDIEIWITTDIKYTGFKMKKELKEKLDCDKRNTILNIKKYYNEKGLLHGEMSTNIYRAVLYNNVNNINEFKEYIVEKLK